MYFARFSPCFTNWLKKDGAFPSLLYVLVVYEAKGHYRLSMFKPFSAICGPINGLAAGSLIPFELWFINRIGAFAAGSSIRFELCSWFVDPI
jgi:hypothetical protein